MIKNPSVSSVSNEKRYIQAPIIQEIDHYESNGSVTFCGRKAINLGSKDSINAGGKITLVAPKIDLNQTSLFSGTNEISIFTSKNGSACFNHETDVNNESIKIQAPVIKNIGTCTSNGSITLLSNGLINLGSKDSIKAKGKIILVAPKINLDPTSLFSETDQIGIFTESMTVPDRCSSSALYIKRKIQIYNRYRNLGIKEETSEITEITGKDSKVTEIIEEASEVVETINFYKNNKV